MFSFFTKIKLNVKILIRIEFFSNLNLFPYITDTILSSNSTDSTVDEYEQPPSPQPATLLAEPPLPPPLPPIEADEDDEKSDDRTYEMVKPSKIHVKPLHPEDELYESKKNVPGAGKLCICAQRICTKNTFITLKKTLDVLEIVRVFCTARCRVCSNCIIKLIYLNFSCCRACRHSWKSARTSNNWPISK